MGVSDDEEDNNNGSDDEFGGGGDSSSASSTYDGVEQLFLEEEEEDAEGEAARKEREIVEAAKRIRDFKAKVLTMFEQEKDGLQRRIRNALDVQVREKKLEIAAVVSRSSVTAAIRYNFYFSPQMTLGSLLSDLEQAKESGQLEKLQSIKDIVESIHKDRDFVDAAALSTLSSSLDDIVDGVAVLKELTSVKYNFLLKKFRACCFTFVDHIS